MICSKCGKEFSDDRNNCPFCFEPAKKEKKKFVVSFTDEEAFGESESVFSFDRRREYARSFEEHENNVYSERVESDDTAQAVKEQQSVFEEETPIIENSATAESGSDNTEKETKTFPGPTEHHEITAEAEEKESAAAKKKRPSPGKVNPKSAKAFLTVKIMVAICVLLTVSLTVVGVATPIFKNSSGIGKTVALTGLSKEAAASFEELAPAFSAFFEDGYDKSKMTFDNIAAFLAPDSENGLYSALFAKKDAYENQADPLGRFSDAETYSYVSTDSEDIGEAAGLLGLSAYDDINTAFCYCYENKYYFAPYEKYCGENAGQEKMQVKVASSKLTNDGTYYIECELYPEDAQRDEKGNFSVEPESKVYFLADCEKNGESFDWAVSKISSTPLFDQTGAAVPAEETDALSYEMKTRTVKAVTSDGRTYAEYVIEYPFFSGDGVTQITVNTLYNELVSSCQKKADEADRLYKAYEKSGADVSRLPLKIHIVSTVTFNEKGYLSLLERTTENDPTVSDEESGTQEQTTLSYSYTTQTNTGEQTEKAQLPKTTYEGYTFEIESGDFVQKDDILGKDYQAIQKLLFEAYKGKEETPEEPTTTPSYSYGYGQTAFGSDDPDGIGQKIYSCAWVLLPDGVGFCYQPENGGFETVVLEYGKLAGNTLF